MKKFCLLFVALFVCITFFSGCKKSEYVVTFNPNGGKGALITQNFTSQIAQPLMTNSFTNRGYVFNCWNTASDGTGTAYRDEEVIRVTEHLVLYAQWIPASGEFIVTFNANGGLGKMAPQVFEAGEPQALSPNAFYFEGYQFAGWNTSPNGTGKSYMNDQSITISENLTLYAQWVPIEHTYFVIFDANDGEGTMEPQPFKKYTPQKLNANTFTREGYFYTGWNTKADGSGSFFKDEAMIQIEANVMLYAQWVDPENPAP